MTLRNADGQVFAKGRHTKFIALAWQDERNQVGKLTDHSQLPDSESSSGDPSD
jgi:hypothetical protein